MLKLEQTTARIINANKLWVKSCTTYSYISSQRFPEVHRSSHVSPKFTGQTEWKALPLSWTFFAQILQGNLGSLELYMKLVSVYYNTIRIFKWNLTGE